MKIFVIASHPSIEISVIISSWLSVLKSNNIDYVHLETAYPTEEINVSELQEKMRIADRIILMFPFHWYSCPHLLKKFIDKTLTLQFAYGRKPRFEAALESKEFMLAISIGGEMESYQPGAYQNYTLHEFLRPFQQTATLCFMKYLSPFLLYGAGLTHTAPSNMQELNTQFLLHIQNQTLSNSHRMITKTPYIPKYGKVLIPNVIDIAHTNITGSTKK